MAKGRLFEYAVLYHPKSKKKVAEGQEPEVLKSELIAGPEYLVATNDQEVGILAARALPEKYIDKLQDIEILIRPFN